jgi:hypothetical protein
MAKQMYRSMAAVRNRAARLKIVMAKSHNQALALQLLFGFEVRALSDRLVSSTPE